jgi:hypothetical protein
MFDKQISDFVRIDSFDDVLKEVHVILKLILPEFDTVPITRAFNTTVSLFEGNFPGYQACNTEYHNLYHTISSFITMARLIHGAGTQGKIFKEREIVISLIATLLHDVGYIQEAFDTDGTGAKHSADHVRRSITFLERHGASAFGLVEEEINAGRTMILCTDLAVDITAVKFPSSCFELLGKMLGAADLLAQMADRAYLEKLLFLYHEFREAQMGGYKSEVDLLRKTIGFYDFIAKRLKTTLDATDQYMKTHFASRWNIHEDPYQISIENQKNYLQKIMALQDSDPRKFLKREGIVDRVRKKYGEK